MPHALTKAALGLAGLATVAATSLAPASPAAAAPAPHAAVAPAAQAPSAPQGGGAKARAGSKVSRFGYNATVFGTKVVLGGVEVRSLKDALVNRPCTRRTGLTSAAQSLLSTSVLPEQLRDIVDFSLSTSTTETYRKPAQGRYGIKAVNTLADLKLGGELLGLTTPQVVIQGLESVADAFYNGRANKGAGAFGFRDSFTFKGLKLVLNDEDQISQSLQTLFDIIGIDPVETLNTVVSVPLNALLQVISDLPLELPGLGSIALGKSTGKKSANGAMAEAYALKITLDGVEALGIPQTVLQLGRAVSNISKGVTAGVFRSRMSALEANIGGLLQLGGIGQRTLPCEGTGGKPVTSVVARAGIPEVLSLSGIKYTYQGLQQGKRAKGFVSTTIGEVKLLQANVVLKGITSRVDLSSLRPNSRVTSKPSVKIGQLLIGGKEVELPDLGGRLRFQDSTGQTGWLLSGVLEPGANSFFGKHLTGLRIQLPGTNTSIDLAVANGEVFFR